MHVQKRNGLTQTAKFDKLIGLTLNIHILVFNAALLSHPVARKAREETFAVYVVPRFSKILKGMVCHKGIELVCSVGKTLPCFIHPVEIDAVVVRVPRNCNGTD